MEMSALFRRVRERLSYLERPAAKAVDRPASPKPSGVGPAVFELAHDDPLVAYLIEAAGTVDIGQVELDSPGLRKLRQSGAEIIVPLISQGELIGLLNLGPRRSQQAYSLDDRRLLNTLAAQAAPAVRVAQLVKQHQAEASARERMEQELRVARVIQQTLLPRTLPAPPGWQIAAHWQPARAVSGDFYDFIPYPGDRLGVVIADVTDKGVPAALVMATTRSILRAAAEQQQSPGRVLAQANNLLCPDMPLNMFVTCLFAILNPQTGHVIYANAGHPPPYQCTADGTREWRARGMPLGLMPDMPYEEKEAALAPGDALVLYSDGLVEAHNGGGEMYGFPRLRQRLATWECGEDLVRCLLGDLGRFTGPQWDQEDDVTFVTLQRQSAPGEGPGGNSPPPALAEFSIASQPGNEVQAMEKVAQAVQALNLAPERLMRLETAVAEAVMNAMEHGNHFDAAKLVQIRVRASAKSLVVEIVDEGGGQALPEPPAPDLEAKLEGLQSPRGWGLYLIRNMVDEVSTSSDGAHHTIQLTLNLPGGQA